MKPTEKQASGSPEPLREGVTYAVAPEVVDVTSGTAIPEGWSIDRRITRKANALLPKIEDKKIAETTRDLIGVIEETAYAIVAGGGDIRSLPPVNAALAPDGSVLLEWATRDFRLGFSIDSDPNESGWYVVTSRQLGEIGMNGALSKLDKRSIVSTLVNFALASA